MHQEYETQVAQNIQLRQGHPQRARNDIMRVELPRRWTRYQYYRGIREHEPQPDVQLILRATQQILKLCSAARHAFVLDARLRGVALEKADQVSWGIFDNYYENVHSGEEFLPTSRLLGEVALSAAVNKYYGADAKKYGEPYPTYLAAIGLATRDLEQQPRPTGEYADWLRPLLPEPGHLTGDIVACVPPVDITQV